MASQSPADAPVSSDPGNAQTLPDRSQPPTDSEAPQAEVSKSAAKKAAKLAKQAAEKGEKSVNKGIAKDEAKKAHSKPPKKKLDGAALIGIDVPKEEDFSGWYQQILTKGDMLDYYDVSGCFILKVCCPLLVFMPVTDSLARLVFHLGGDSTVVQHAYQEDGCEKLFVSAFRFRGCLK